MSAARTSAASVSSSPGAFERFLAWWEGIDLGSRLANRPLAGPAPKREEPAIRLEEWETPRLRVKQAIWGDGFHAPGGGELALELVKPFALNKTMSVLDFGCGSGGGTRAIAKEFDIWMTGVERDGDLYQAAKALSKRAGMERRAEILRYDSNDFASRPGGFDCILSMEALHAFEQREILLSKLENALKNRGQIQVTDFALAPGAVADHPLLVSAFGPNGPDLWQHTEYEKRFKELNFDLRISEDMTDRYREMVIAALMRIPQTSVAIATARAFPEAFIEEVERLARRIGAIDMGLLKIRRLYGIKLGSSKMMSDWS